MNADLEAAIADGRRRMKQFEEKTSHELDMFDREVDNHHHLIGHRYSHITEDLKPISAPLWGVILETSSGHQIYKENLPFDIMAKCPRHCACTRHLSSGRYQADTPVEDTTSLLSVESKTIIEGHKWGVNKYLYDDEYVSNPPYGTFMKRPTISDIKFERSSRGSYSGETSSAGIRSSGDTSINRDVEPNTKLVSQYWRRKWKIPNDW